MHGDYKLERYNAWTVKLISPQDNSPVKLPTEQFVICDQSSPGLLGPNRNAPSCNEPEANLQILVQKVNDQMA